MKTLLDYCEENEGWYDNIDHCADIICKFVETHKRLSKKLTMLLLTDTMSTILQEFYEKVLAEQKEHFADVGKMINSQETAPDTGLEYNTKWIGKLCKFRDGDYEPWQYYGILTNITPEVEYPYRMQNIEFAECQPVSEEEFKDVIYKRE